jgi:hypothetical protein
MAFTLVDANGPIVTIKISGEIERTEVTQIQAAALGAIQRCGKISALFILDDFRGWKRDGNWGDISFMTQHDQDIAKIAVVGDEQWCDLFVLFSRKDFALPPSNISFPWISRKRARGWKPTNLK